MKLMVVHTMEPNSPFKEAAAVQRETQKDPAIRGLQSFLNLTEGKAVCIYDAPDRKALAEWLRQKKIPFDSICPIEYEGKGSQLVEIKTLAQAATK